VKDRLAAMTPSDREHLTRLLRELKHRKDMELARTNFLAFVQQVWPGFIYGRHHARMAQEFEKVVNGECKRLIINLGPRHSKSEFGSYLLPAWFLGKYPDKKIIQCSHTADLAVGFGRKVRNLVGSAAYQEIFPGVGLQVDSKAAGRWNTSAGGDYFAIGVGGAVTGKGADILIVDDPHALTLDTLVPTTKGFKTVADIAIGDIVFGPDGKPTKVIDKSAVWKDRPVYEVTTDDNVTIECDGGHLWNYRSDTKLTAPHRNATTRELAQWVKASKPCLPRHAPVQYSHKQLLVDPYILGAWLGDGTTGLGRMTSHPDDMGFMRAQFELGGYLTTTLTDPYSFGVKGLRANLLKLGVRDNKHIPTQYLTASIAQRMALLQGLMDTDGDVTEAGQCSFNNCNKVLAVQFQELIHSLGVKAKLHRYEDKRLNHNPVYRVTYKLKDCCRMARKNSRTYTPTDKRCRSIYVKETSRRADMQCITVDRTDGLFLVSKAYVVTHNSEQEAAIAASNPEIYDKVYEWYTSGPRQRLQPGGAIIIIQTRWSLRDLSGQVLEAAKQRGSETWRTVSLPAVLPSGKPLWPEFWSIEELEATRDAIDVSKWQAQYQQDPTSEEGALIKRDWWQRWPSERPPETTFVLQTWDTAFEKTQRADYSACTTWGVFYHPDATGLMQANIILLDAKRGRYEFPELKKLVLDEFKYWEPDSIIIEKKASGAPLIYELRAMGIPVGEFTPTRGNDKISRLNSVSDIFSSGRVWVPNTRFADEVVEEVAAFPAGQHDDYVDTVSMAMARFRKGGFITTNLDKPDEIQEFRGRSSYRAAYY
jgi:predicted phage terminase large subunit-like protein